MRARRAKSTAPRPAPTIAETPPVHEPTTRQLAIVFGLALAVRLLYLITADGPSFQNPLIDGDYYDYLGVRLSRGEGFPRGPFWQPPAYPLILAGLYSVFGHGLSGPRVVQALLDATMAVLAVRIAYHAMGQRSWAIAAGVIVGLHGTLVFYSGEILPTGFAVTMTTGALWLAVEPGFSSRRAALCGTALGLGTLAVATSAVLALPIAWFAGRSDRKPAAIILLVTAAFIGVATHANHMRSGEWIPISANGGVNLYLGNAPDSARLVAIRPGAAWEKLVNEPAERGITSPSGQDQFFVRKALGWCASAPIDCAAGFAWKTRLLLRSKEIPRNESVEVVRPQSPVLQLLLARLGSAALPHVFLLPAAAAGLVSAFRRRRPPSTLVAWTAVAAASMPILFFVTGRYRTALAAVLAVLAVMGAHALWTHRRNAWPELAAASVVLVLAVWPAHQPVDEVPYEAEMFYAVGGRRARLGDGDGAIDNWQRAVALRPDYLEAHFNLGLAYVRAGRWGDGAESFEKVVAIDPGQTQARLLLEACREKSNPSMRQEPPADTIRP